MDINTITNSIVSVLINPAILLLFGVALVIFIWGLVQFLWAANAGGKGMDNGKRHMLWGTIGMFIMVAAFGILTLIDNTVKALH